MLYIKILIYSNIKRRNKMKRIISTILAAIVAVAFAGVCYAQDVAPANNLPANHPTRNLPANHPTRNLPANHPTRNLPANHPTRNLAANHPTRNLPANHPTRNLPAGHPTTAPAQ